MRTDKATVFDLFEKQRRYLVPLFQRGYVWQQATEWELLWNDITSAAQRRRKNPNQDHAHFLGAIVLSQAQTMIRQVAASEIIDGQQRLLTLQVLLIVLRDTTTAHGNTYSQATLDRLTNNPGPHRDPDEACKVWPTNAYHDDLRTIKNTGNPDDIAKKFPQTLRFKQLTPPRPPLIEAYLYFTTAITTYLTSKEHQDRIPDALDELTDTIIRHLQLVSIELDKDDDPQVIFETLNARGVPLGPADLIRNFLFLAAARHHEPADKLYDDYWKAFDEKTPNGTTFWQEKERQGRLTRSRLDLFFFHYTTLRTTNDINVSHLFTTFKNWWNNPPQPATENEHHEQPATPTNEQPPRRNMTVELNRIKTASTTYRSLITPTGESRLALLAKTLKALDTTTAYPLVLWLCEQQPTIPAAEFDGILRDLESYLVRRTICNYTTKAYNRNFLTILTNLQAQGTTRAALQAELNNLNGDTGAWPDDQTVTDHLIKDPLYTLMNQAKVRVILEGIERDIRTTKQEDPHVPPRLSIEHVLPQTDDPKIWPYPESTASEEDARIFRDHMKHTIGNLTLLTKPLNSGLQNGPFKDKRPEITKQSQLQLNAYFQDFTNEDAWNESTILERSKTLAKLALHAWPHNTTQTTTA